MVRMSSAPRWPATATLPLRLRMRRLPSPPCTTTTAPVVSIEPEVSPPDSTVTLLSEATIS